MKRTLYSICYSFNDWDTTIRRCHFRHYSNSRAAERAAKRLCRNGDGELFGFEIEKETALVKEVIGFLVLTFDAKGVQSEEYESREFDKHAEASAYARKLRAEGRSLWRYFRKVEV